jgi:aminotransferase
VISDEVYKTLLYDGARYESIITREGMRERTVLIDSMSKRFSMTGYRCGFAIGPAEIIRGMTNMQENTASCTPLPSQYAAMEAYTACREEHWIQDEFERRRNLMWPAVNGIPGLSCLKPAGTFYLFVNIEKTGMDSLAFATALLEEARVAVVPGITYGEPYDGYVRIAFTRETEALLEAAERIRKFAGKYAQG